MRESLLQIIARELEGAAQAPVEHAIFGHAEPARLARELERRCEDLLGSDVHAGLFYRSSIGAVAGVELGDGGRAVLKAYQPDRSRARLVEVVRLQRRLEELGRFAPAVLAGPGAARPRTCRGGSGFRGSRTPPGRRARRPRP